MGIQGSKVKKQYILLNLLKITGNDYQTLFLLIQTTLQGIPGEPGEMGPPGKPGMNVRNLLLASTYECSYFAFVIINSFIPLYSILF